MKNILISLFILAFALSPIEANAANFLTATFSATPGTSLGSYTSDSGATWTSNTAAIFNGSGFVISPSGDVRASATSTNGNAYVSSAIPPSANYGVMGTFNFASTVATGGSVGVVARVTATNADTGYQCSWYSGNISVYKRNSGVTQLGTSSAFTPTNGTPFTLALEVSGSQIVCKLNGTAVVTTSDGTYTSAGFAEVIGNVTSGSVGDNLNWQIQGLVAYNLAVPSLTKPVIYQTFQRNSFGSNGTANIPIAGVNSDVTPHSIEASFNGGAYQTIATNVSAAGSFSGTLTNQAQGQGVLTVRFVDAPADVTTVTFVGIGDIYVLAGQSNAVGQITTNQQFYHQTLKATCFYLNYSWGLAVDPLFTNAGQVDPVPYVGTGGGLGTYWMNLATYLMATNKVPVAFIPAAEDGAGLASAQTGTGYQWTIPSNHLDRTTLYGAMNYRAQLVGGVREILWHGGETDTQNAVTASAETSALIAISQSFYNDLGVSTVPVLLQTMTSSTTTAPNQAAIRLGILNAINTPGAHLSAGPDLSIMTTDSADGLHIVNQSDAFEAAALWAKSLGVVNNRWTH